MTLEGQGSPDESSEDAYSSEFIQRVMGRLLGRVLRRGWVAVCVKNAWTPRSDVWQRQSPGPGGGTRVPGRGHGANLAFPGFQDNGRAHGGRMEGLSAKI